MNIILCGMMGVGKTTVGLKISELSGRTWYDTDELIAHKHGKISDIFEYYGEEHFRMLETEIVKKLYKEDNLIISTGGGLVLRNENNAMLKENGKIVFLRAKKETLISRVKIYDDSRPLLQGKEKAIAKKLDELLEKRTPVYESVADFVVDVDDKSVVKIAKEIIALFKE